MKTALTAVTVVLVAGGLVTAMFFWGGPSRGETEELSRIADRKTPIANQPIASVTVINPGSKSVNSQAVTVTPAPTAERRDAAAPPGFESRASLEKRVAALEATVKSLQDALNGVSLESASADRQALFASAEGYLKADEYFEAGKFAIAGEGYLTFVQNHPDHPDAREVMKKARDAFLKAGYKDKAFWVQEEMMKNFPANQVADLWEQAQLEKDAGLYDRAVTHAAQAADLATSVEDRLWKRLYWAWYVQLRDGANAGIAALQQVQREIATSGVQNPKLNEHATKRMREWQLQAKP